MTDERIRKDTETDDEAEQLPSRLVEGALRGAGLPPVEDVEEDVEAEPGEEPKSAPPEEPQTSLDVESLGLVIAAGRGFTPRTKPPRARRKQR